SGPFEWGGGQRWLSGEIDPGAVRAAAAEAGGHAVLFRAPESLRCRVGAFAVPAPAVLELHRRVKRVFDPSGIFNPGRLYAEL
ncbi:MAG TPA: FAD-linked oxidase C-terminal domain-containing protein, partial [Rhodocyclaceae bacterium]|nr:FAD-linked oxidase C-terminal domain-containing protein [Rhodocyclaceae bacterium]